MIRPCVSIVVATRNRCASLQRCLEYMATAGSAEKDWEVIVADNGSTDDTAAVAGAFTRKDPQHFHYVYEGRAGKSRALNTGIAAGAGEVVAFTDDDCYVTADWIRNIADEFSKDAGLGGLVGGVELYDRRNASIAVRGQEKRTLLESAPDVLWTAIGCNLAVRRKLVEDVGGFDCTLGPGTPGIAAEDLDFVYRIFCIGAKLAYAPTVKLYHHHGRQSDADVQRVTREYVRGRGALYCKHILGGDRKLVKVAYWEVLNHLRSRRPRFLWWLLSGARRRLMWNAGAVSGRERAAV